MVTKFDLVFSSSYMNATGMLGFVVNPRHTESARLGAFVTNPISLTRRKPARAPEVISFPGGFLLHTGHPNPGLRAAIQRYSDRWARMEIPVVVHLLCERINEVGSMIERIEKSHSLSAIEIGLPPHVTAATLPAFIQAANSELPLILQIPLERVSGMVEALEKINSNQILSAISLGPPRGILPAGDERLVQGRLYGPAIFPQAIAAVRLLANLGIPVIGGGGVYSLSQAEMMMAAGARAVQFDTVLWRGHIPDQGGVLKFTPPV